MEHCVSYSCINFWFNLTKRSALIGEPISGQLLDKYSYLGLSLFAGLALILSMVTLVIIRFKINPKMVAKV